MTTVAALESEQDVVMLAERVDYLGSLELHGESNHNRREQS